VTTTVLKNLSVTKPSTDYHPLMLGPSFLYGNSDTETYFQFFHHLGGILGTDSKNLIVGSDEEKAIRNAIKQAFPDARRIICMRHLKNNVIDYCKDKVGLDSKTRQQVTDRLFGEDGVIEAHDRLQFELKLDQLKEDFRQHPTLVKYLDDRIGPLLTENFETTEATNLNMRWTNNNCESMNHVLKQAIDWKSQRLTSLIMKMEEIVTGHYREVKRSLLGLGDFQLCQEFHSFRMSPEKWTSLNPTRQDRHFRKFLLTLKLLRMVVRSRDRLKERGQHGQLQ
jgi:hypothetical protein